MRPLLISCLALAVAAGCAKKSEVVQAELAADAAADAEAQSLDTITVTGTRALEAQERWDPLESTCRHASLSIL